MDIQLILKKIRKQKLSPEEKETFDRWYAESAAHRVFYQNIVQGTRAKESEIEVEEAWIALTNKLKRKPQKKKWYYVAAAAAVILVFVNLILYKSAKENSIVDVPVVIEAGTDKATLTLEDGSVVNLQKNDLFHYKHIKVKEDELLYDKENPENPELKYNILSIPRGGQYRVTLADGTRVWLNSDTRLRYPVAFRADEPRRVELVYGEAFFEVSPSGQNHGNNFEVISAEQTIEVTGTAFNVANYREDQNIETTLVEGKVALSSSAHTQKVALQPGHQVVYSKEKADWQIKKVDTDDVAAWKNGYFKFKEKSLEDIMKAISRWYDVEVQFEDNNLKGMQFNGVFNKNQKLEDILDILKMDGILNYTLRERKVLITGTE